MSCCVHMLVCVYVLLCVVVGWEFRINDVFNY